jgi:hypothetical protein
MRYGEYGVNRPGRTDSDVYQLSNTVWLLDEQNVFVEYFMGTLLNRFPFNPETGHYELKGKNEQKEAYSYWIVPCKKGNGFRRYAEEEDAQYGIKEYEYYILPETFKYFTLDCATTACYKAERYTLANAILKKMCMAEIRRLYH